MLIAIAGVLRLAAQRAGDLSARHGGEEFAVLLPGVEQPAAVAIAERLRAAVQALAIAHAGNEAGGGDGQHRRRLQPAHGRASGDRAVRGRRSGAISRQGCRA